MEEKELRSRTTSNRPGTTTQRPAGERSVRSRSVQGERRVTNRPIGEQQGEGRPAGSRPAGTRPAGSRPAGSRPAGTRPAGSRPAGSRPAGERPAGERPVAKRRPVSQKETENVSREEVLTRTVKSKAPGTRPPAGRKQAKRRRKRNLILKMSLLVILLFAAVVGAFLWKRYSPSKEKADLKEYYGIEHEEQYAVTIDNEVMTPGGRYEDGQAYIQYELVRDYINGRIYWDPNENILLYTLPNDIVKVEVGSKDYTISRNNHSKDYVILKTEGSTAFIALDFVKEYTDIEYQVYDDNVKRMMIVTDWTDLSVAEVKKDTQVRYRGGVKSPVLTELSKKDKVTIIESEENWKKVRTEDGFVGYVKSSMLKGEKTESVERDFKEEEFTNIKKDYVINMAWHNVTNSVANDTVLQRIAKSKGLTTIAPTWYHVANTNGDLSSISSADYVSYAHQANIEVWATVRDFDGGISSYEESYEFLSTTSHRTKLINQLIADALQTGIDGINVDFEKISEECGEHYIQFIRELSVRCRQNGLVLSVDNYVPKGFNMQYNRKEQGIVADYVVIMGYDEHYGGSLEAGSVSSYNFVKEGIEETLKEVPADKVISGIPFFTRLWEEKPKTEEQLAKEEGTEAAEYPTVVNSQAYGMSAALQKVKDNDAEIIWDEETQQDFATWSAGDVTYKIWLENEKSLEPKLQLMKDYGLAGTAAWALGQEDSDIWKLILKYTN